MTLCQNNPCIQYRHNLGWMFYFQCITFVKFSCSLPIKDLVWFMDCHDFRNMTSSDLVIQGIMMFNLLFVVRGYYHLMIIC